MKNINSHIYNSETRKVEENSEYSKLKAEIEQEIDLEDYYKSNLFSFIKIKSIIHHIKKHSKYVYHLTDPEIDMANYTTTYTIYSFLKKSKS